MKGETVEGDAGMALDHGIQPQEVVVEVSGSETWRTGERALLMGSSFG
jgi:hypothetical protein